MATESNCFCCQALVAKDAAFCSQCGSDMQASKVLKTPSSSAAKATGGPPPPPGFKAEEALTMAGMRGLMDEYNKNITDKMDEFQKNIKQDIRNLVWKVVKRC